jgi:hypothetical protein
MFGTGALEVAGPPAEIYNGYAFGELQQRGHPPLGSGRVVARDVVADLG